MVAEHSHQNILEDLCCDFEKKRYRKKIRCHKNDEFENEKPVRTTGSLTVFSSSNWTHKSRSWRSDPLITGIAAMRILALLGKIKTE